jgi:hypothetical protein
MNAKKTAEGYIFHFSGDLERAVAWKIFTRVPESYALASIILGRMSEGGGETFCVFSSEVIEFEELLSIAREDRGHDGSTVSDAVLSLAQSMRSAIQSST